MISPQHNPFNEELRCRAGWDCFGRILHGLRTDLSPSSLHLTIHEDKNGEEGDKEEDKEENNSETI